MSIFWLCQFYNLLTHGSVHITDPAQNSEPNPTFFAFLYSWFFLAWHDKSSVIWPHSPVPSSHLQPSLIPARLAHLFLGLLCAFACLWLCSTISSSLNCLRLSSSFACVQLYQGLVHASSPKVSLSAALPRSCFFSFSELPQNDIAFEHMVFLHPVPFF